MPRKYSLHINLTKSRIAEKQALIDAGALSSLFIVLKNTTKVTCKKEVLWTLSNIAAGTKPQKEALLNFEGLMGQIKEIIMGFEDGPQELLKEGVWIISNLCDHCDWAQALKIIELGMFEIFDFVIWKLLNPQKAILIEGLWHLLNPDFPYEVLEVVYSKCVELDFDSKAQEIYESLKETELSARIKSLIDKIQGIKMAILNYLKDN